MSNDTPIVEDEPSESIEVLDSSVPLAAVSRAEIDIQIATAKRWPRAIDRFKKQVRTLATLDEETAGSMFYALPREGRTIEGPSIRFAEVVGSAWTNLRYGARIVAIDERHVTAQGAAFDLENNLACTVEAKRRITDKRGRRYSDDMITVTSQAAMSIALRNAIFRVVPFALVKDVYEEARAASIGRGKTMAQRRQAAADVFAKFGLGPDKMCGLVNKASLDELDDDALIKLRGMVTAVREGDTTIDEILREAAGRPVVVEPETLGGVGSTTSVTAEHVLSGDVAGVDAPVLSDVAGRIELTAASRLDEIDREAKARGCEPLVDQLLRKYAGTAHRDILTTDPGRLAALGRVLSAIKVVPLLKGK